MTANNTDTTTTSNTDTNPDDIDKRLRQNLFELQAKHIATLQAEIAERQDEIDMLKSLILDSHPAGTYMAGDLKVQVKPGARRVDGRRFEKTYPAAQYPDCYQLRPKPLSQLEKLLTTEKVEAYTVSGKPTVVGS